MKEDKKKKKSNKRFFEFVGKFKWIITITTLTSLGLNLLTLLIPRVTARAINGLNPIKFNYNETEILLLYGSLALVILILGIIQTILASYVSEKAAAELRNQVIRKISSQSFSYVQDTTVSRLLTNLTSDVDAVKAFFSQGIVIIFSSIVLLVGSAISLLTINWQLALPVIMTVPILFITFAIIFSRINKLFTKAQEIVDSLNKVINETIVGAALIRVLNSMKYEKIKFEFTNNQAREVGVGIVNGFAALVPMIGLILNLGTLVIVGYGGSQIIDGTLNPGDFAAFFTYLGTFIMPVISLGFLGTIFTRAFASFERIEQVLENPISDDRGNKSINIEGEITLEKVSLNYGNTSVLRDISLKIKPGTRNAIIGPTAAGKSQIFYLIAGLLRPTKGKVEVDNVIVTELSSNSLYSQMGLVFQDSVIYNTTIGENIGFSKHVDQLDLEKAIETAQLKDYISSLEKGLKTSISERGTSLSGGQKQRIMLARALSINPKILLLDDFTARVDVKTEREIFSNLLTNYPKQTIVSITQKIEPIKEFDQIFLIMEGELIASGKHKDLLKHSFEYKQIYESQQSTNSE